MRALILNTAFMMDEWGVLCPFRLPQWRVLNLNKCLSTRVLRATYTQDWEPMTGTLQTLSLAEKLASHYAWGTNGVYICECKMDIKSTWIPTWHRMDHVFMVTWDYFQKPPLGGRPNTKPLGDHGTMNTRNHWFVLFYHVWGPALIGIHWNSIRLRARSHMTSHYTWGSVTTLHNFGGVLGHRGLWTLFFWALTIPWSRTHGSWLVCGVALS